MATLITGYKENGECRMGGIYMMEKSNGGGWGAAERSSEGAPTEGQDLPCQNLIP